MEQRIYLNLTNGIEFLEDNNLNNNYKFVRIQSSACERHLWDKIIRELDYNFLIDIALGYEVVVYDTSQRKNESRAMYQGLKFIEYVLNRVWLHKKIDIKVKEINVKDYFEEAYLSIPDSTIIRLKYVKKFLNTDTIRLKSICKNTIHDGDYDYYRNVLIKNI